MKQQFSEEQMIGILKQQEGGTATAEICRKHGISAATFYKWKSKYGGLNVSEAGPLRQLEAENAKIKSIVADQALDIVALKDINSKTGEARCQTRCREVPTTAARLFRSVGLSNSGLQAQNDSPRVTAWG